MVVSQYDFKVTGPCRATSTKVLKAARATSFSLMGRLPKENMLGFFIQGVSVRQLQNFAQRRGQFARGKFRHIGIGAYTFDMVLVGGSRQ